MGRRERAAHIKSLHAPVQGNVSTFLAEEASSVGAASAPAVALGAPVSKSYFALIALSDDQLVVAKAGQITKEVARGIVHSSHKHLFEEYGQDEERFFSSISLISTNWALTKRPTGRVASI